MELTSENVEIVFKDCLFKDGENADNPVVVEGIMAKFGFHEDRLKSHADHIAIMLSNLPVEFQRSGGGGMSFLNACDDKDGKQWTGMHHVMDHLFSLGVAVKKAELLMPREMWKILPGGMPYYVVV